MITVLYVQSGSFYERFKDLDLWNIERNAILFKGKNVLIAHPPCRGFGRLRSFSNHTGCELLLAYSAISKVRVNGGIVEHPISSTLWQKMKVGSIKTPDRWGGYLIKIHLSDFGFKARKPTGLYIVGCKFSELPVQPISFDAITHSICTSKKSAKKELDSKIRSKTPVALIHWFLEVAQIINDNKNLN